MADYLTTDTELISVANAIRQRGGTVSQLVYPQGYIDAILAIGTSEGLFPVGSMYATRTNTDPASILGFGTWLKIRESKMTWGEMKKHTWGELKTDTWSHIKYGAVIYVWRRTA